MYEVSNAALAVGAALVLALAASLLRNNRRTARDIVWSMLRMFVQLSLLGIVLQALFDHVSLLWVTLIALVMMAVAAHEVTSRQRYRRRWQQEWLTGLTSLSLGAMALTLLALTVLVEAEPWYQPRYAIPFLGMLLGNTMTGIAMTLHRVREGAFQQAAMLEARLALGDNAREAVSSIRADALRQTLISITNMMAAAGVVSLPGMMTGQLLAGAAPASAVRYQILIILLICAATGLGAMVAAELGARQLFDQRQRLRLERFSDRG